jgi:hypothetical protein
MPSSQHRSPLKTVAGRYYVHVEAFASLPPDTLARLAAAESLAQIARNERFNVVRFDRSSDEISLLNYPRFFEDAFPDCKKVGTSIWQLPTSVTGPIKIR